MGDGVDDDGCTEVRGCRGAEFWAPDAAGTAKCAKGGSLAGWMSFTSSLDLEKRCDVFLKRLRL